MADGESLMMVAWILLVASVFALLFFGVGVWATIRHTRRRLPLLADAALPPVSILKPLKGTEESLAENLRSFLLTDSEQLERNEFRPGDRQAVEYRRPPRRK